MDPLTALSVAGTIVQFVDFANKILKTSGQFYRSATGASTANEELELVTKDLSNLITKLRRPLGSTAPATDGDEKSLESLCDACSAVASELAGRLGGLKIQQQSNQSENQRQPNPWESFGAAVKSAWAKKEIEALKKRLAGFRDALEMHVIINLR
jgi:hypothetical protein